MKKNLLAALILSTLSVQVHATTQLNVWEDIKKSSGIKEAVADFEKQYDVKVNVQKPLTPNSWKNCVWMARRALARTCW